MFPHRPRLFLKAYKENIVRRRISLSLLMLTLCVVSVFPFQRIKQTKRSTLDFYFIDVEGGAATLIVTPAGESVLIDAGWEGFDNRDAKRIQLAMQQAGITQIDHLVATHYHQDHYSGIAELSRLVTIKNFYDHGKMDSLSEDQKFAERFAAYQVATKGKSIRLKPGDTIPLKMSDGKTPVKILCVAANADVINSKKSNVNPECNATVTKEKDTSENGRSVALLLSWGGFEFLNLADLTWNISQNLVCPYNQIGEIDLYQVTHHGGNINNNPVLLRSLRPSVAVMINGPHKGGHPDTIKWLQELPLFKALYQLHRNVDIKAEQNISGEFIANPEEQNDEAHFISVSVNGVKRVFTATNGRTKTSKTYQFK